MRISKLRLATTALCALALTLVAATGATAAATPKYSALSSSTALRISLTVEPAKLASAIEAATGQTIPGLAGLKPVSITQVFGHARSSSSPTLAEGIAQPAMGDLLTLKAASSSCTASSCPGPVRVAGERVTVPSVGFVEVGGATSHAKSVQDVTNDTALTRVRLSLTEVLSRSELALLKNALDQAVGSLNGVIGGTVNPGIETLKTQLASIMNTAGLKNTHDAVTSLVKIGSVRTIDPLSTTDLLNLVVMGGTSTISQDAKGLVEALGRSQVANVSVLGDWFTLKSVSAESTSKIARSIQRQVSSLTAAGPAISRKANQLASSLKPSSTHSLKLQGLDLGGLLQLDVPDATLLDPKTYEGFKDSVMKDVPPALASTAQELLEALDIVYYASGISFTKTKGFDDIKKPTVSAAASRVTNGNQIADTTAAELGLHAASDSGAYTLVVEPKLPLLNKGTTTGAQIVPRLDPKDAFASLGLKLEVVFPNATSAVSQGAQVLGQRVARTGVGTSWLIAAILIGSALVVRRFALSR